MLVIFIDLALILVLRCINATLYAPNFAKVDNAVLLSYPSHNSHELGSTLLLEIDRTIEAADLDWARVGASSARFAFKLPLSSQSSFICRMGRKVVRVLKVKLGCFFVINCSLLLSSISTSAVMQVSLMCCLLL